MTLYINNQKVAVIVRSTLNSATPEIWRKLYDVNVVAPGLVDTPMTENWDWARDIWREKAPMQRGAKPEEIADIAKTVIESSYLTGEVLLADGGLNLT